MARRRPTAFEVSFPEDAATVAAQLPSSSSWHERGRDDMGSATPPLKRPSEGPPATRPSKIQQLLPVSYYQRRPSEIPETGELVIAGEDPDSANEDEKPIRVLSDFTFFDPRHRNEIISLATLESADGADRECEGAGYVKAYFEDGDDEDEGQEDDLDGGEMEYVRLGAVLRVTIDYSRQNDPMYIETVFSWYILDTPSEQYKSHFQDFFTPRRIAQMVVSSALNRPQQDSETFIRKFINTVDPFGRTYTKQDLWDAANEIEEALEDTTDADEKRLRSGPLLRYIIGDKRSQTVTSRKRRPVREDGPKNRHLPRNKLIGNPDLAVLKAENQNQTHVTPRIAALAQGLIHEELQVVGPPLPAPNKALLDKQKKKQHTRVCALIDSARKTKRNIDWKKEDRISSGSKYVKCFQIDGDVYHVGDVVLLVNKDNNPEKFDVRVDVPVDAAIFDFFWFAKIHSICHDSRKVHIQWFEHGSGILLQELAHPQELFLVDLCGSVSFTEIIGKVNVLWDPDPDAEINPEDFLCKLMYDKETSSFFSIRSESATALNLPPPDNCPVCVREAQHLMDGQCQRTTDTRGYKDGIAYAGKKYHLDDFVLYYGEKDGPADIGYIVNFRFPTRETTDEAGLVICRRVGRIVDLEDILPAKVMRDERHLFITDEVINVRIEDLLGIIYVPCRTSLSGRIKPAEWLSISPDRYYMTYEFPTLHPSSWTDRRHIDCSEFQVCAPCWKEELRDQTVLDKFLSRFKQKKLATLDLFGGVGAFSSALSQGSGCMKVTHAIEISPSAAQTFKRNSPDTVVYNQCANIMLRHTIKTWEGHKTVPPMQLFDGDTRIPPVPKKDEIKVIVAGFPCQAHSAMNMYKKASDVKNNLMLNALSWVDLIRPTVTYMENVPGFLGFRLNATQATVHRVEGGIEMGGLKFLVRALIDMGYQVRFALLQAGNYGTPQGRIRFFLVASLIGTPLPELPQPSHAFTATALEIKLPYSLRTHAIRPIRTTGGTALHRPITVDDAIGDLPRFDWKPSRPRPKSAAQHRERRERGKIIPALDCDTSEPYCGYQGRPNYHYEACTSYQREARSILTPDIQHYTKCLIPPKVNRVIGIPLEANADYRSLKASDQEWQMNNPSSYVAQKKYKPGLYGRLDKDSFFPTTVTNMDPTAKQSRVLNPYCKRMVTVRELARSQGFPDHFVFESIGDNVVTMHRQIGNAVPLPVGRALGRELRTALIRKWRMDHGEAIDIHEKEDDDDDGMMRRPGSQHSDDSAMDTDSDE